VTGRQGLYEVLGVRSDAPVGQIRAAYRTLRAELRRRQRQARQHGADVFLLELKELELREAMEILGDPQRRRRYDAFRGALRQGMPVDAVGLWEQSRSALISPIAPAAVDAVRALTDIAVGDILPPVAPTPSSPGFPTATDPDAAPPITAVPHATEPSFAGPGSHAGPGSYAGPSSHAGSSFAEPSEHAARSTKPSVAPEPPPRAPLDSRDEITRLSDRLGVGGPFIQAVRELRGVELNELSRTTRISRRLLAAIEANRFDRLPAATFVQGYIRQIADELGIAERGVVEGYMGLFHQHRG